MRRTMAGRDFLHTGRVTLSGGSPSATIELPLANDFRLFLLGDPGGIVVLYRNARELGSGIADPTDVSLLVASECSQLDEYRNDSGWCPAQPSAVRLRLTSGTSAEVVYEYTSRTRPT